MTSLQKIAMGLVLVLVDASYSGWDAVPDVLGWVLAFLGVLELRARIDPAALLSLAALSGTISLALIYPPAAAALPESTAWLVSLPQLAFTFLLCGTVAGLVPEGRPDLVARLTTLRWAFVAVAVGPVVLYGGGVDVLLVPLAVLAVAAGVYLVYLLFRASSAVHGPPPGRREPSPD